MASAAVQPPHPRPSTIPQNTAKLIQWLLLKATKQPSRVRWRIDPAAGAGVAGDVEEVADAVRRWADAGADVVVLQPTDDEPDPEGFVRFAGEVHRLIGG